MTSADLPDPIRRRLERDFSLSSASDSLRRAARQLENEFAAAILHASSGADFDVDRLLEIGAQCGLTPFQTYAALRSAEDAHKAWLASVHISAFK